MFVVLETAAPYYNGIIGRILNILTKPAARAEPREAFGAGYGAIISSKPASARDWDKINALAGRYADRLIIPEDIIPPPGIPPVKFPRYEKLVLLKTATEIVKRTRMPMYRRVAGLVDLKGEYADFLYPLLQHYTTVRVITAKTDLYEQEASKMMHELGAPVIISGDYSAFSDCVLVVAPDGITVSEKLKCPVLSKEPPKTRQLSDFITGLKTSPPPEAVGICPNGIDPHRFLAAIFEYCGVDSVCVPASRLTFRYSECDINRAVLAVMESAGTSFAL